MFGFNSVHYPKYFTLSEISSIWLDLIQFKTVENGWIFQLKTIKRHFIFVTREFLILFLSILSDGERLIKLSITLTLVPDLHRDEPLPGTVGLHC